MKNEIVFFMIKLNRQNHFKIITDISGIKLECFRNCTRYSLDKNETYTNMFIFRGLLVYTVIFNT